MINSLDRNLKYIDGLLDIVFDYYHRTHPLATAIRCAWTNPDMFMIESSLQIQIWMYFTLGRIFLEPPVLTRS